jgi:hypothetical protein
MRLAMATLLSALVSMSTAAPVSIDDALPIVSRERLCINTVQRGDLVRRLQAFGSTRRTDASVEAVLNVGAGLVQEMMVGQFALVGVARGLHEGRVSRIQPVTGNDYLVAVSLESVPAGLGADEPVAAAIQTDQLNDVLLVRGVSRLLPGSTVSLFKLEAGSDYATRVEVHIGKTWARQAEIFGGLAEGDRVITVGIDLPENISRIILR